MEIDNSKNSHPYLVVGCSYHCFPIVHQRFCEPGVIGRGGRSKESLFSHPNLQDICKHLQNYFLSLSATHLLLIATSHDPALDMGGGGPDSLIERSPYLPPVAHKIAPQYFYFLLLQNHQRVPYLGTFQDIMRLISIFCCHHVSSSEQTHGNHLQILRDVLRLHTVPPTQKRH